MASNRNVASLAVACAHGGHIESSDVSVDSLLTSVAEIQRRRKSTSKIDVFPGAATERPTTQIVPCAGCDVV
ncbi:hypothetical protein Micbo1qcDRAFT_160482 [Microdochium bolleyi]|uniref:Uncharacterized protein n=1 Tax=Microdochium bolleyi TaxID=196109 RepID=A0A136J6T0_9PEZI|nr:hypothetical protein Micbo1qcDRAFT_160482 [Microdochium bolleyi]